ncbi:hypothetical protein bAD24_I09445 [Burkholderia sp. AD24]|nr:hypothetical protein bAD24_I09445 [Burkholderia sp. AD24]
MKRTVPQAEISKLEADANIDAKLDILREWISNGIPCRRTEDGNALLDAKDRKQLDYFPTSLRQFKAWDGSQNSVLVRRDLANITATGNDTLAKRPGKQELARRLINALCQRATIQLAETGTSEVKRLTAELAIARATIDTRNAELREQQRKLRKIERDNARLEARVAGDATEFKAKYEAMQVELENQKREHARLIATLAKVRPLTSR